MKTTLMLAVLVATTHLVAGPPEPPTTIRGLRVLRVEPHGVQVSTGTGIDFISSEKMTPEERKAFRVAEPEETNRYAAAKAANVTSDQDLMAQLEKQRQERLKWERSPEGQAELAERARVAAAQQERERREAVERQRVAAAEAAAAEAASAERARQQAEARQFALQFQEEYFRKLEEDALREREVRAAEQSADELRRMRREMEARRIFLGR